LAGRSSFGKSGRARLAGSARWPKTRASKRAALPFHSLWARACQWETTMAAALSTTNAARASPGCALTIVMGQQLGLPACTRDLGAWRESLRSYDWLSPAERLCQASRNRHAAGALRLPATSQRDITGRCGRRCSVRSLQRTARVSHSTAAPQRKLQQSAHGIHQHTHDVPISLASWQQAES
jgi:hypothetical protein